jgi:hypothetical protein
MNAIIRFFQSIFSSLFGEKTTQAAQTHIPFPDTFEETPLPEKQAPEPPAPKTEQPIAHASTTGPYVFTPDTDSSVLAVDLVRYSSGTHDTLGRLYIQGEQVAYTLEDEHRDTLLPGETRIPAGTYPLSLRTAGGRHATYLYRFGDMHKGMLWIRDVPGFPFALICIGNNESDTEGSVLVGTETVREAETSDRREIWYSEQAYRSLYPRIADHLAAGKPAILRVQ